MRDQTKNLEVLANIVCCLDEHKNDITAQHGITTFVHQMLDLVAGMKMELMPIGELQRIAEDMKTTLAKGMNISLRQIDQAHIEIKRLAGDEVDLIY